MKNNEKEVVESIKYNIYIAPESITDNYIFQGSAETVEEARLKIEHQKKMRHYHDEVFLIEKQEVKSQFIAEIKSEHQIGE